jgi:CheY-like chemotaxis protein
MNLVLNARDAMPSGGCIRIGTRKASPAELTPPYDDVVAEGWVALTVADTGLGMDEATRQHIFEPFFTTKEKGQGTGLGLSVVYGTVSRYGGQIHVESAKAQGTRFILLLPTTSPEYAPKPTPELEAHPPMSSVRVLVVEDDTIIRGIVARVLTSRGYDVIVAANGEDALELVQSRSHPPHLLLTDVVMPGISGPKLAAKLRVHWPRLRVLYMSGYTFAEMDEDTAPDPTEAFVSKPFSPQELCSHVEQLLRS